MSPISVFLAFLLIAGLYALSHWIARTQIRDYAYNRGWTIEILQWTPFGPGWFGERDSNIFFIRYTDRDGAVHDASCKAGLFSGVYFTEDVITFTPNRHEPSIPAVTPTAPAPPRSDASEPLSARERSLTLENEQLRSEVARLQHELDELRGK